MAEYLIYTKPNCPYCVAAKHKLASRFFTFEERDVTHPGITKELLERDPLARTVPQIYTSDGVRIGTYKELLETLGEEGDSGTAI